MPLTSRPVLALCFSLASACGSASPPASNAVEASDLTLSPDLAIEGAVEHWAERWSAATGLHVVVGEGGVPIEFVGDIPHPDGSQRAGWTAPDRSVVLIHYRAKDVSRAIGHELGHLLGADEHTDSDGILYREKGGRAVIDAPALGLVCAAAVCPTPIPEGP
jgi:hypothetical protein